MYIFVDILKQRYLFNIMIINTLYLSPHSTIELGSIYSGFGDIRTLTFSPLVEGG